MVLLDELWVVHGDGGERSRKKDEFYARGVESFRPRGHNCHRL